MTRSVALPAAALALIAAALATCAANDGDAAAERVVFERIDRSATDLLVDGNVWDSPAWPVDRLRKQRFTAIPDSSIELNEGALLVAQLPGRVGGDVELALAGAVSGAPAKVRLAALLLPDRELATTDRVTEALTARIGTTLLERDWPVGDAPFRAGPLERDRDALALLLAIEVPAGGKVLLRHATLREAVAPRPEPRSVGGETRPSLLVAAGTTRSFPLPALPAGARVAFAVAPPEGLERIARPLTARCRLAGAALETQSLELRDGPAADGEAVRRWRDAAFAIARDLPAGGALEVAVAGDDGAALLVALPTVEPLRDDATPPDLVLISLDTLRADRVGALGGTRGLTPAIDRFAQRCVRFTRCYSPANFTVPAHGSLMTGLQPVVHGAHRFGERRSIRPWPSVAEACAQAGMATAAFTGGGYVDAAFGFDRGFSRYRNLDALMTPRNPRYTRSPRRAMAEWNVAVRDGVALDDVTRWLADHADRRSFLFFHTYHAHDYSPAEATARARAIDPAAPWPTPVELQEGDVGSVKAGSPQLRHYESLYDATVAEVDAAVGRLLQSLEESGALDRSIVVLTADHGEGFLEHDVLFHTTGLHDEIVHVPLLIHAPGIAPRTVDAPVSLVDLAPTMVELVGAAPLPETQGTSLVPLLRGEELAARPLLIQDCPKEGPLHSALVVGRFKYVRRMRAGAEGKAVPASERLFDVVADPGETRDLASEPLHAATLAQARAALDRMLAEMEATALRFAARRDGGDVGGADLDADLHHLGYGK